MRVLGIICEYNPFHNGHKYHIEQSVSSCDAEGVVTVMSGNFVQRGEPALCDKASRTKMAIMGGADLVIELPCVYSCQSAEYFARGGVALLEAMNCDYISFGSESGDLNTLIKIAEHIKNDNKTKETIAKLMKTGISYPRAVSEAFENSVWSNNISSPNDVLAIEYLKAVSKIKPIAIKRYGSVHDGGGSASDIRNKIANKECIDELIPSHCSDIINSSSQYDINAYEKLVLYKLRTMSAHQLRQVPDVCEGLENRILSNALKSTSLLELCDNIKTKRYTMARIRRILLNSVLGITKADINKHPQYIRVLGMNKTGMRILSDLKDKASLPIITKAADAQHGRMLDIDFMASDIYSLISSSSMLSDYRQFPVII